MQSHVVLRFTRSVKNGRGQGGGTRQLTQPKCHEISYTISYALICIDWNIVRHIFFAARCAVKCDNETLGWSNLNKLLNIIMSLLSQKMILTDNDNANYQRHNVWKSPKMSHLNFWILAFSTNFCPIKIDLSGNTVWPQASGFQKLAKLTIFWHF